MNVPNSGSDQIGSGPDVRASAGNKNISVLTHQAFYSHRHSPKFQDSINQQSQVSLEDFDGIDQKPLLIVDDNKAMNVSGLRGTDKTNMFYSLNNHKVAVSAEIEKVS